DQAALALVQPEVIVLDGAISSCPHPQFHPQRVVGDSAGPAARLLDQVHQLVAGGLVQRLALGQATVELTVALIDNLFEEPVLGFEVVKNRGAAGSGSLRDVPNARAQQAPLIDHFCGGGDYLRLAQVVDLGSWTHPSLASPSFKNEY